jgi:hypothetical protein
MSLEKVAIKNERPGIMLTPGLRPPDEDPPPEDSEAAEPTKDKQDR